MVINNFGSQSETRQFLTKLWKLEDIDRPAYQINLRMDASETILTRLNDAERMLQFQLNEFDYRKDVIDDFVPALFPYQGTAIFPSAFGCDLEWFEDNDPWARPVIEQDRSLVYQLGQPTPQDGLLSKTLDFTKHFVDRTEGKYPIRMTDIQSPLDTAYQIWKSDEFLMAMYEDPPSVHRLLEMITKLIIDFINAQRSMVNEFVPCHFPNIYMPDGMGVSLSEDLLSILSPNLYEEFGLPYVNRISDSFNGVFLHSCGNFVHNLPILEKVNNLRGLDFAVSEMPFEPVADLFGGKTVLSVRLGLNKEIQFPSIPAFVEYVLQRKKTNRGLFLIVNTWLSLPETARPWRQEDFQEVINLITQHG